MICLEPKDRLLGERVLDSEPGVSLRFWSHSWSGKVLRPETHDQIEPAPKPANKTKHFITYLWLVGSGRMVVIVDIIVPHSSIPY